MLYMPAVTHITYVQGQCSHRHLLPHTVDEVCKFSALVALQVWRRRKAKVRPFSAAGMKGAAVLQGLAAPGAPLAMQQVFSG